MTCASAHRRGRREPLGSGTTGSPRPFQQWPATARVRRRNPRIGPQPQGRMGLLRAAREAGGVGLVGAVEGVPFCWDDGDVAESAGGIAHEAFRQGRPVVCGVGLTAGGPGFEQAQVRLVRFGADPGEGVVDSVAGEASPCSATSRADARRARPGLRTGAPAGQGARRRLAGRRSPRGPGGYLGPRRPHRGGASGSVGAVGGGASMADDRASIEGRRRDRRGRRGAVVLAAVAAGSTTPTRRRRVAAMGGVLR
jgi:hypothetical protein